MMPRVKIIFLTMNPDPDVASEALRIGASGYLLKNSEGEELLQAVRNAVRGFHMSRHKSVMRWRKVHPRPEIAQPPKHLSERQREVLQMLAEGRSMKEIAYILQISHRTVRFHKYRIMEELGITNQFRAGSVRDQAFANSLAAVSGVAM